MRVRYVTKGGEMLYGEFDESHGYTFEHFFYDRIQHECGFFPYEGGRINADMLVKIECCDDEEQPCK